MTVLIFDQNFAGIPKSDSSRMVLHTLEKSFSQCRGFQDLFERLREEKYTTEFVNMVSDPLIK
jgi:hypothetical protein